MKGVPDLNERSERSERSDCANFDTNILCQLHKMFVSKSAQAVLSLLSLLSCKSGTPFMSLEPLSCPQDPIIL